MNNAPKLKPGREYYKAGRTLKRKKIPMKPPIPCVIVRGNDEPIKSIRKGEKTTGEFTTFPSRTKARKELWHILQNPENWPFGPFSVKSLSDL